MRSGIDWAIDMVKVGCRLWAWHSWWWKLRWQVLAMKKQKKSI